MIYLLKSRTSSGATTIVSTFHADTKSEARERFTFYITQFLLSLPGYRFVEFLPTTDGRSIESTHLDDPDYIPVLEPPEWFLGEGFYDAKNRLILRADIPETGTDHSIQDITIDGIYYYYSAEKIFNTMEACAYLRITRNTLGRMIRRAQIEPLPGGGNKHLFSEAEVHRAGLARNTRRKAVKP